MREKKRGEASIVDANDSTTAPSGCDATSEAVPKLSDAATHLCFAAASNQFNALTRFGSEGADAVSIQDRARAAAERRKEYESIFLREGAIEIDSNGLHRDLVKYSRAVEAIRAKAAALGYGAQSQAVPITAVPGGYVGRFGGNDIYAASR